MRPLPNALDPEANIEARETLAEAIMQALIEAYGIADPRSDADGPDIEFQDLLSDALDIYEE